MFRPNTTDSNKSETIRARVSTEELMYLNELAARYRTTISAVLRQMIQYIRSETNNDSNTLHD